MVYWLIKWHIKNARERRDRQDSRKFPGKFEKLYRSDHRSVSILERRVALLSLKLAKTILLTPSPPTHTHTRFGLLEIQKWYVILRFIRIMMNVLDVDIDREYHCENVKDLSPAVLGCDVTQITNHCKEITFAL